MKKIKHIFSFFLVAVSLMALFTACASDEGNYDYTQSNDLTVKPRICLVWMSFSSSYGFQTGIPAASYSPAYLA